MNIHYLPVLIPILFLMIWLEWQHNKEEHPDTFRFESTVLNICCGIIERVFDLYIYIGIYFLFNFLQSYFGLFELAQYRWWQWLLCFVGVDFLVYWYHRGGHVINFLWASHVTHHQCEEFNLSVAFRNSVLPNIFRAIWLSSLAILGFPAEMIIISLTVSGLWQFCLHTTVIDKLGPLEYILSTPSSHRVHHGQNEQYLDKNFGGFFIIWDRLFGTYAPEIEPVKYGITNGFDSVSPVKAYFHVWKDLFLMHQKAKTFSEKINIWFGTPADFYTSYKNELPKKQTPIIVPPSPAIIYGITVLLIIATALTMGVMACHEFMSNLQLFLAASAIIIFAIAICAMAERKRFFAIFSD